MLAEECCCGKMFVKCRTWFMYGGSKLYGLVWMGVFVSVQYKNMSLSWHLVEGYCAEGTIGLCILIVCGGLQWVCGMNGR